MRRPRTLGTAFVASVFQGRANPEPMKTRKPDSLDAAVFFSKPGVMDSGPSLRESRKDGCQAVWPFHPRKSAKGLPV